MRWSGVGRWHGHNLSHEPDMAAESPCCLENGDAMGVEWWLTHLEPIARGCTMSPAQPTGRSGHLPRLERACTGPCQHDHL